MPAVFPKVTICNSLPAITEYAFDLITKINEQVSPGLSVFNQSQMGEFNYTQRSEYFWKLWNIFLGRINSRTFTDLDRKKLGHSLFDILYECLFNGQPCTSSDFNWHWNPIFGNCYVFNSGSNSNGSVVDFKMSSLSDVKLGFQLLIYVGYNEKLNLFNSWNSFMPFSNSYGLNVLIENNTYLSDGNKNPIALNGGTINYISLSREFSSNMPKPYSNC
jgi:hypothetical protein